MVTVPVFAPGTLPIGIQIVAPPWHEARCLRAAAALEAAGAAVAHPPAWQGAADRSRLPRPASQAG